VNQPDLSFVTVGFGSSGVLARALASLRREAASAGMRIEVVVVDHTGDDGERQRLQALSPDRLVTAENRGYAAGLNRGLELATGARVMVGNPDIELESGALEALLAGLGTFDIVGPQFTLGEFRLPPADLQGPLSEWRRRRAGRSEAARRALFGAEVERCRRVWEATGPVPVPALSGALLLFERSAAARVGSWDEGYFLFFEETDWLRRARRAGLRLAVVPAARVLHRWGHAADARDPAVAAHFARSRRRFYARHFGVLGRWLTADPLSPKRRAWPPLPAPPELPAVDGWWLVSPSTDGLPAAGARLPRERLHPALARLPELSPALGSPTVTAWDDARGWLGTFAFEGEPAAAQRAGRAGARPAEPADEASIDRLFAQSFGHVPPPAYWQWKYSRGPAKSRRWVAVDRRGAVVAHAGALALPARLDGRTVDVWQLVDFMGTTANSGLRPPLVEAGRRLLADLPGEEDAPWIFGFPSPRHFRLGELAFGYRPLREIAPWSGPIPETLAGAIPPSSVGDRAPLSAEAAWSRCAADGIIRSREFLDWRYWARPERYYRFYGFGAEGEDGFAVFAFQSDTALAAELWLPHPGQARGALLGIAADLRSAGFRSWSFWPPIADLDASAVAELGMTRSAEPVFVGIRPAKGRDPAAQALRFGYVMGDYDLV
jgi:GT2 family glycosyltransferase